MTAPKPKPDANPYALTDEEVSNVALPRADEVLVAEDSDMLIDLIAADIVVQAKECVRNFGDFHLALSGGSTPQPLYERLMYDPDFRALPWQRTHLWIVDERRVAFDNDQSNYKMIREIIVDHAGIPQEQVHPIYATSDTADVDYEKTLRETLMWREKGQDRLDCVVLGMGDDGHTASLFPYSDAITEEEKLITINRGGQTPDGGRVTMTYPLINAARFVSVLVIGKNKSEAIARVTRDEEPPDALPVAGIEPVGGRLKWYLDAAAASLIMDD